VMSMAERSQCRDRSRKKGRKKRDDVRDRTVAARAWAWGWRGRGSERACDAGRAWEAASDRMPVNDSLINVYVL